MPAASSTPTLPGGTTAVWPEAANWPATRVRQTLIDYFRTMPGYEHTFWPSSNIIPFEDDSLLFVNAGMNQYKPIFLGTADPKSELGKLVRAVNSQKCIRAGGKHNDLDDVGKDNYHHTFFEMLGNWSFGDYFKVSLTARRPSRDRGVMLTVQRGALVMAWDLLTRVYGLPKDRLYVTYFEGDGTIGLEPDLEARQLWLDMGLEEDHVLPGNTKDNFWEMGASGPCGPCSEIHFDRIGHRSVPELVNADDPNVVEIWNIVFIQYNREEHSGTLRPLPNQHVDMGFGFERLVSVLHDVSSNYDTDLFTPIFTRIQEVTGAPAYGGKMGEADVVGIDTAYRVIADHARTLTIALSDGGVPDKDGRGYVLRRILRRGARYASSKSGVKIGTFFSSLVPAVVESLGATFPDITKNIPALIDILNREEMSFARTLIRGEALFAKYAAAAEASGSATLSGEHVWRLYDTYGFPVDLTELMAEERGLEVDRVALEAARAESVQASKAGGKGKADASVRLDVHDLSALEKNADVPKTDDTAKYKAGDIEATMKGIYHSSDFHSSSSDIPIGETFGIILDKTNFYAQQGGQVNDTGTLSVGDDARFTVEDAQVFNGYVLHIGKLESGTITIGDRVKSTYDELRRGSIRNNHTATHLLSLALRQVLGDHVTQKGSLVAPNKLRFDFSHEKPIALEALVQVEKICNDWISKAAAIYAGEVPLEEAQRIPGLRAVFGEAYPDPVRVVSIGTSLEEIKRDVANPKWMETSIELCGGTHVSRTDIIRRLIIVEESSVAKGVRRIAAVTGNEASEAAQFADEMELRLAKIEETAASAKAEMMRAFLAELGKSSISVVRKHQLRARLDVMRKEIKAVEGARVAAGQKMIQDELKRYFDENPNENVYVGVFDVGGDTKILAAATAAARALGKAAYVFSADETTGRVTHANYLPPHVLDNKCLDAKSWLAEVTTVLGGKGGGEEDYAIGVGSEMDKIAEGVALAKLVYCTKVEGK